MRRWLESVGGRDGRRGAKGTRRAEAGVQLYQGARLCKPATLGPHWVRVTTVEHGHGRSPTVAHGSEEPQVAGPSAQAPGITQTGDSDCGPEGQESSLLGCLLNREELDLHFQGRELPALGLY
jgi:hypothetical protein